MGTSHRVAVTARKIVLALGGSEVQALLAYDAGHLHDYIRPRSEKDDGELASAEESWKLLTGMGNLVPKVGLVNDYNAAEVDTVVSAIKTHTVPKELLAPDKKNSPDNFTGDKLVRLAVFVADKLEANGSYIIARRAQFVGGERFSRGDIKDFRQRMLKESVEHIGEPINTERDSLILMNPGMAVLLESYIRLGYKNNPGLYPDVFLPVVNTLFEQQRSFYHSLLKAYGITEGELAGILKEGIRNGFPGMTVEQVDQWEAKRPRTDELIQDVIKPSAAEAAMQMVGYFSSEQVMDMGTEEAIRAFVPRNDVARTWHREMLDYLDGNIDAVIQKLRKPVALRT